MRSKPILTVMCQNSKREEPEKPYAEEPKNSSFEESRNPYNEEQAKVSDGNVGDQHKEGQSVSPQEEAVNVYGGEAEAEQQVNAEAADKKWPGVCVPVQKVGAVIGRKGECIERMCEESRARIKVLDGPPGQ